MSSAIDHLPALCSFETVLATERALNDFISNVAKGYALRTTVSQLEMTASEQYIYKLLRDKLEAAKAGYHELQKRQNQYRQE